jgi:TolB-like protein/DNA-binding winged helix-turn-helix (wHTH) protein/Tfp pilus assembly protein PilF
MVGWPTVRQPMAIPPLASERLRFDDFELDVRAGELRRRGVRLRLRGQPLQVLAILLEHAGDVVTREQLQSRIWPADTFVDFDHSLHNAIARIREVLGDSAERPRYIETLPRRGYRYIGPLEDVEAPSSPVESVQIAAVVPGIAAPNIATPGKRNTRFAVAVGAVSIALALVGLIIWRPVHQNRAAAASDSPASISSIAVLPLTNLSGDPAEEFFSDGMTDQVITDLARVSSLRVISRTSTTQYKGTTKSLPEIAHELNVDAIVEGSVIRSGQRVRVTAQLLEAHTDRHLWAETYDRERGDILVLQAELAGAIAQQVRAQTTPLQQQSMGGARAVKPAAYDAYIQGRLYFTTEYTKPASLRRAQHLFEAAIREDPGFALAYAGLADTYVYLAYDRAMPQGQAYAAAQELIAKAMKLDDSIGESWDTLGALDSSFDWDWQAADQAFSRAIALAPSYSCAHEDRAIFLASVGRRSEALAEIAKIDQLDTGFSSARSESEAYFALRDYVNLMQAGKRGLLLDPTDSSQHFYLAAGYEGTGKLQEAIAEYQKAAELSDDPRPAVALAHAWVAAGEKDKGVSMLRGLEHNPKAMASPYTMATIYAGLGENDRALQSLREACVAKSLDAGSIRSDFLLDSLRPDPRFQALLRHIGLS